jgi:hypothetical protein
MKKIASTPEAAPLVLQTPKTDSENSGDTNDERITISQRTGYIQVKPRQSTDCNNPDAEQLQQQQQSASIGQRRLSKNGERTSTPPRKILPKGVECSSTPVDNNRPHLPVGLLGAALSSSRPAMVTLETIALKGDTTTGGGSSTPPRSVPLSQPLLINTNTNTNTNMVTSNPPVQLAAPPGGIIMPSGLRMPMQMQPIQIRYEKPKFSRQHF